MLCALFARLKTRYNLGDSFDEWKLSIPGYFNYKYRKRSGAGSQELEPPTASLSEDEPSIESYRNSRVLVLSTSAQSMNRTHGDDEKQKRRGLRRESLRKEVKAAFPPPLRVCNEVKKI